MPQEEKGLTVIECPPCSGRGKVLKYISRFKETLQYDDWEPCKVCEGSGRVFVVPARIIGPYKAR